jgi:hypothetical protein
VICKGTRVVFEMKDDSVVRPPAGYGMMHDPSGKHWSACALLIGPFTRGVQVQDEDVPTKAKQYLGRTYHVHKGEMSLPPKSMSAWTKVGECAQILYVRGGRKAPGGFHHEFGRTGTIFSLFKGVGRAQLYRCGRFYQLRLGRKCMLDERGVIWP